MPLNNLSARQNSIIQFVKENGSIKSRQIEELFGVEVSKVNTISVRGKHRRQGKHEGFTPNWKKAVVTLKESSKGIDFFDSML